MKDLTNEKKLKILVIVLAVLLVAAVVALIIVAGGKKAADDPIVETPAAPVEVLPSESVAEQTEATDPVETEPEAPDIEISTPYGTLYYPGQWKDYLQVEQISSDVHTVKFLCRLDDATTLDLFSIAFGGDQGYAWVNAPDGTKAAVNIICDQIEEDTNWTSSQRTTVFTMQEALNMVLNKMEFVEADASVEPTVIPEDDTAMDIETPYGVLKYPARWSEYLVTKVNEKKGYSIKFSAKIGEHDEQHLFTIYFGGKKGIEAATVGGEKLLLELAEPELDDSWTDEERLILTAMQEDMNYLLSNLPA